MSSRTTVVLVCDLCGSEDLVSTHRVSLDGVTVEAEVCDQDWQRMAELLAPLGQAGRRPELVKVSQRRNVVSFPGEPWDFTSHSLIRMGERKVSPGEAVAAAEDPTITHPGDDPSLEVRVRGSVKAVVNVKRRLIVTVSRRDEEVEGVA